MASRPANFFSSLSGVPVLYDRLKREDYGRTGISYKFYCTSETQAALEALFQELFARTVVQFGPAERILSAGSWVDRESQHGLGRAFDLDAIHWSRVTFIALEQPTHKPLYLAIQALCNKHLGMVLGYDYNADHHDHLHLDISRPVQFRQTSSVTTFVQQALNTFFGQMLEIDGEFGESTSKALSETLSMLGLGPVGNSVANWRRFLDIVCERGVAKVVADLASSASPAGPTMLSEADPQLAVMEEARLAIAQIATAAGKAGSLDVNYKPFAKWAITSQTIAGKERWFLDFDGGVQIYLGYRFSFSPYLGLARTGASTEFQMPYDHESYRPSFGEWASFIYPTARCESESQFLVVNAWDAAAMTLGFIQMAAHTGEHLADLFRELIAGLPDEADKFFPELKLGKQIGQPEETSLFAVSGGNHLNLDRPSKPADGMHSESYYRGRFMGFFNPHRGRLDAEEVAAAARWVAWMMTSAKAREICVGNAVSGARRTVGRIHAYVKRQGHPNFPNGLDGIAMDLVAAAFDVKHHGRRNRELGESSDQSMFGALSANDPMAAFAKIDTDWREDRSRRSVKEITAMKPWFAGKAYDAGGDTFA